MKERLFRIFLLGGLCFVVLMMAGIREAYADNGKAGPQMDENAAVSTGREASASWDLDPDGTLRIRGTGSMEEASCDWDRNSILMVVLEQGITEIPDYTFQGCKNLESIQIPDGVTRIGRAAFQNCSALRTIVMPDSVIEIGESAFQQCRHLRYVRLSASLTTVENGVFAWCTDLEEIVLPANLNRIRAGAFSQCACLKEVVFSGSALRAIDRQAFFRCENLKELDFPKGLESVGAFAFCDCASLSRVDFPDGLKEIGLCSFAGSGVENVWLPDSVSLIGQEAFYCCENLSFVSIGANVEEVERYAFDECGLTEFHFRGEKEQWEALKVWSQNDERNGILVIEDE